MPAETRPDVAVQPEQDTRLLPQYRVVLHNDEVNTFDHVILSILRITPLSRDEAIRRTIEAHETGAAVLLVTHQERAELYVDQFASRRLTVTAEPD
jgi:ATP-dependent Clp protease adaptor protein ClpS